MDKVGKPGALTFSSALCDSPDDCCTSATRTEPPIESYFSCRACSRNQKLTTLLSTLNGIQAKQAEQQLKFKTVVKIQKSEEMIFAEFFRLGGRKGFG